MHKKLNVVLVGTTAHLPTPIVKNDPYSHLASGSLVVPQYGKEYQKWLEVSVKIQVPMANGSGTIVYSDSQWTYVQTCGHLWGNMQISMSREDQAKSSFHEKCKVFVFYDNHKKLSDPLIYDAQVLYYMNKGGIGGGNDCALLRFRSDRVFPYIPIGSGNYKTDPLYSTGCDGGSDPALYVVRLIALPAYNFPHLVTTSNSPRPGRSGGGLFNDKYLIGVSWGTSNKTGIGNGYFTSLQTIRYYNQINGYGWLNDLEVNLATKIPVFDHTNRTTHFPSDYIPTPLIKDY